MVKSIKRTSGVQRTEQNPVAKRIGEHGGTAGERAGFLSKVDPSHVVELAGSVTNAYRSKLELESERERTDQKRVEGDITRMKLEVQVAESVMKHEQGMTSLRDQAIRDRDNHTARIAEIEKDVKQSDRLDDMRNRLLGLLESGKISAEECNAMLATLQAGGTSGTGDR